MNKCGAFKGATSKPPPRAFIYRRDELYHSEGNIWDTRDPGGRAALRPLTAASTTPTLRRSAIGRQVRVGDRQLICIISTLISIYM